MNKAAQAAATERLRLRLQLLHTTLQNIRSPGQLTDAMAEAGCIYYELMQAGLVPSNDWLLELGRTALKQHCRTAASSDVADNAYLMLWVTAAEMDSQRKRLLSRPLPDAQVPPWHIRRSTQAADQVEPTVTTDVLPQTGSMEQTQWGTDYAEQGMRYALYVAELLAGLQTAKMVKPLSVPELEPEVTRVVADHSKQGSRVKLTADAIAALINATGKVTSSSNVKNTNSWKYYVQETGKKRNPAATLTNTDAALGQLLGDDGQIQGSKGRRNKKPVNRSDD